MIYEFRGLELDTDTFELRAAGTARKLEPQVFDVLALLVAHRDRVVTKDELLDRVWGDRFVSESALTSRVKDARRAVDDDGRRQEVIRTVHGRGYRFVARVEERAGEATAPSGPAARAAGITTPPRTRYARSGTYSIAYQVVGDGPANLVFIPGYVLERGAAVGARGDGLVLLASGVVQPARRVRQARHRLVRPGPGERDPDARSRARTSSGSTARTTSSMSTRSRCYAPWRSS